MTKNITKIDGHSVGFSPQYLTRRFLGLKIVGLKSEVLNRQFSINKKLVVLVLVLVVVVL